MIRELPLICNKCNKRFTAEGSIYYQDNFLNTSFNEIKLLCSSCLKHLENKWQITDARFYEIDCNLYVDIILEDGTEFIKLDCTPLDDIIITSEEMPLSAKQKLFNIYEAWHEKQRAQELKKCLFTDDFMRTTFSCETYSGEEYNDIAFRINLQGVFETESPIPEDIKRQVLTAWRAYEKQNTFKE